jgi:two-component system chemotaxis response regulator CheY
MNILVADDDSGCVCLLQEVLTQIPDVQVITAGDGAEAWWWLTHPDLKYALAILDVKMPKVDGFDLVSRIRLVPYLYTLPVIMCTGATDRRFIGKAAQLNISCYLMKPFSPETLYEKAESLLPHRSGRTVTIS